MYHHERLRYLDGSAALRYSNPEIHVSIRCKRSIESADRKV
jgi:hypothetical protein